MNYTRIKLLFAVALFLTIVSCKENNTGLETANAFARDLANDTVTYENIIAKHLCTGQVADKDAIRKMKAKLLIPQLSGLREALSTTLWSIKKYVELPAEEQDIQMNEKEQHNVYVAASNGRLICFIWIKHGKVLSFSTINKAGKRFFLKICDN